MFPRKTIYKGQLLKYTPIAKENEIGRLMGILEQDLGEQSLNSTGQKLVDSQHASLDMLLSDFF